ncbi:MAG TPA: IMP dehydrogenase [Nitrososphaerales archaeon]|nr:IMP dehydrogenase [Nitrososphaerales archaeon]
MPQSFVAKLKSASQAYTFRDFILLPGRSEVEPRDIDLSSRLTKNIRLSLPFVSSPMDTVTEWRMAVELAKLGAVGVIHRNMSIDAQVAQVKKAKAAKVKAKTVDDKGKPLVGASVSPLDTARCEAIDKVADFMVADVAHFHNSNVLKVAAKLLPNLSKDFVAGNIGTKRAVHDILAELPRVDGFRVGIGSGSVCITSEVTRVGAPTLFAVSEVATAVSEANANVPIIADGGIRGAGDASLALAAGASTVMLGSMLAGCDESPSSVVVKGGKKMKVHRGMASSAARAVRFALDRYSVPAKGLEEGVEAYVAYSGKTEDTISRLVSGMKASFGYSGAKSVEDLWSVANFGYVSPQGTSELGVHSLTLK